MQEVIFKPIGKIESCFKQKFTIPRQPGIVKQASAKLHLLPEFSHPDIIRGLEIYSHIWVIFVFHESHRQSPKTTVRPPRLNGEEKLGVFATRSNFRINPIGQSVVKLEKIETLEGHICLHLSGIDFLDQTPVLDIKPYIPYTDAIPQAEAGFATTIPDKSFDVLFDEHAAIQVQQASDELGQNVREFITDLLAYDPRPIQQKGEKSKQRYQTRLFDYNLVWSQGDSHVTVTEFEKVKLD